MNLLADRQSSPPLAGEARQLSGLPAVECGFEGAEGKRMEGLEWRKRRPPAPLALSRSPILYLVSLRWAAGRRWHPVMRNGRK